ncbi:hypothetical protein REPUB_Repub19eG0031800 [Reevesia pubescens]
MKASLKGRYTNDKSTTAIILVVNASDVNICAFMTDTTIIKDPSLNVRVANKPLKLTYIHDRRDNRMAVDDALVFDSANKVSANYMLGIGTVISNVLYVKKQMYRIEDYPIWSFIEGSFAMMGDKVPTKVAFFAWDAT